MGCAVSVRTKFFGGSFCIMQTVLAGLAYFWSAVGTVWRRSTQVLSAGHSPKTVSEKQRAYRQGHVLRRPVSLRSRSVWWTYRPNPGNMNTSGPSTHDARTKTAWYRYGLVTTPCSSAYRPCFAPFVYTSNSADAALLRTVVASSASYSAVRAWGPTVRRRPDFSVT